MNYDENLIYDLGLHKGEDTEYYLKRGFRVIAVEADEDLVSKTKKISNNILKVGI